jgi:hypothetical protein
VHDQRLFQDALFNRTEYGGYMEGTILPQPLRHLEMHLQHRRQPIRVIDNYGDLDEQEGLASEAIDKTTNTLTLAANAVGTGLVGWADVDLVASPASTPHQGQAVDLSWNPPLVADVSYTSDTGGIAANTTDVIAIRVGQFYEDATVNTAGIAADLFVTLYDCAERATVRAGQLRQFPIPMCVRLPQDSAQCARSVCPSTPSRL